MSDREWSTIEIYGALFPCVIDEGNTYVMDRYLSDVVSPLHFIPSEDGEPDVWVISAKQWKERGYGNPAT